MKASVEEQGTRPAAVELRRRFDARGSARSIQNFLKRAATLIRRTIERDVVIRGRKTRGKPEAALRHVLTQRSGKRRIPWLAIDRKQLPSQISVGSGWRGAVVHERGGAITYPAKTVKSHTRRVAFGKRIAPFRVPAYQRSSFTARYPARPWLAPAVDIAQRQFQELMLKVIAK